MKAESMASEKLGRVLTVPSDMNMKAVRGERRATWIAEGRQENHIGLSSRRKLSIDTARRNLFSKATRSNYDELLPAENFTSTKVDQPVKLLVGDREVGQKPITIMSVLRLSVEKYPDINAYAYKSDDNWQYVTYKDLLDYVKRAAKGFISFGLERFSGVAIIGHNAPEWAIANLAAIYAGGIVVPIATAVSVEDCCNIMQNTRCNILVVDSSKQLDDFEQIRNQLPFIKAVIKYGNEDNTTSAHFHTWEKLLAMGDKVDDERLQERISSQAPNLCCTIMHTPGTIGPKKPVMLSQDNLIWTARSMGRRWNCCIASGRMLCLLTFAHVASLIISLYVPLLFASTVYFISSKNVFEWTREIKPTSIYAPPSVFDELRLRLTSHLTRSCFARIIYWWAKTIGLRGYRAMTLRQPMPICWSLANAVVYQKIRIMLGLQNSNGVIMGGQLVAEESLKFFAGLNIPILGIYGMTESSGPVTVSSISDMSHMTSVGKELEGCFSKLAQKDKDGVGEIRIRGRHVFMGYLNEPEMTSNAFDGDGWFKTGDLVRRDDGGFLYIFGKVSDLVTLQNGEKIHSGPIETRVREALPFIRNCMLVGNGRSYVVVLLAIKTAVNLQTPEVSNILDPEARKWFQQMGYKDESIDRFLKDPDKRILDKIQDIIDGLNAPELPSHRIKKWTMLPRDFTVQGGEITWTRNIRRFVVEEKYAETIKSLYIEK